MQKKHEIVKERRSYDSYDMNTISQEILAARRPRYEQQLINLAEKERKKNLKRVMVRDGICGE